MNITTTDGILVGDIPPRFRAACEPGAVTLPPAVHAEVERILAGIKAGERPKGVLLSGSAGTGKSTAAAVALVGLRRAQRDAGGPPWHLPSGRFYGDGDIIRRARAAMESRGAETFDAWLDGLVERRNLIVLDDLAAGGSQPYTGYEARLLGDVVDTLYREIQPTIVTTNKSLDELGRILGDRVPSRLAEMTEPVVVDGVDRRLQGGRP